MMIAFHQMLLFRALRVQQKINSQLQESLEEEVLCL